MISRAVATARSSSYHPKITGLTKHLHHPVNFITKKWSYQESRNENVLAENFTENQRNDVERNMNAFEFFHVCRSSQKVCRNSCPLAKSLREMLFPNYEMNNNYFARLHENKRSDKKSDLMWFNRRLYKSLSPHPK